MVLKSKLVPTQYWELGEDGKSRKNQLAGPLLGTNLYVIDFLLDGIPLSGTPVWKRAPRLIAPAVAHCLKNLLAKGERLLFSVRSGPDFQRDMGKGSVNLRAEEAVYFDYIVPEKIQKFSWLTYRDEETHQSELVFEPPEELVIPIAESYWEWHSFSGYVIEEEKASNVTNWLAHFKERSWKERRAQELKDVLLFFEDWADACSIRLWTKRLSREEILSRLRLEEINRILTHISPDVQEEKEVQQ
jgi:hypothetical protein